MTSDKEYLQRLVNIVYLARELADLMAGEASATMLCMEARRWRGDLERLHSDVLEWLED